ncbi:MAG TPA: helix-hairpin-helix domain-containing protein [Candidatus Dormibacteraeota bacterium]
MRHHVRLVPGWKPVLVVALPVVLGAGAVTGTYLYRNAAPPVVAASGAASAANLDLPSPPGLLVDVAGAVAHPGLYRLQRGDRVYDAVAAAGGLTGEADPTRLPNLAGRLRDGEQVKVPFAKGVAGSTAIPRVNLNSATLAELELVPGFTVALAVAAVDYRTNFGGFENTRELVEILGMSEADFLIARRYLAL